MCGMEPKQETGDLTGEWGAWAEGRWCVITSGTNITSSAVAVVTLGDGRWCAWVREKRYEKRGKVGKEEKKKKMGRREIFRGIRNFRDDKLKRGEEIESELLKAIEESRLSIIIFSPNYAHSRWCLDELLKIMECRKEWDKQFYQFSIMWIHPCTKQTGSFGEAFDNHKAAQKKRKRRCKGGGLH
ncbi:TMV resistance protein N [Vitis vinifera]|uniref:ADP-ribosyl cyclase/cyclic ADP-ribose hydrolase n=1 Tax=Vitis vinifera TaxID=29760 RepID=A0A438BYS1_VITVI|nr:TMV resistance protein N [Vitis vinifera]